VTVAAGTSAPRRVAAVASSASSAATAATRLGAEVPAATVTPVRADLATLEGCEELYRRTQALGRPVDAVALNAGIGPGGDFFRETDLFDELRMIRLNVDHVVILAKRFGVDMVARGSGRFLITSSVAASAPHPYLAVYAATKAFERSFGDSIREELSSLGADVTVTLLQPGPTDTEFFDRAGITDTRLGASDHKDDPATVAEQGFRALMDGKDSVVAGSPLNKVQAVTSDLLPDSVAGKLTKPMTRPGGAG